MEAHGDKLPPYLSIVGKDTKISNRVVLYDLGLNKLQIIWIIGKDIKKRIVSHFKVTRRIRVQIKYVKK